MKWIEWNEKYNQWFFENELNNAINLKNKFDKKIENVKETQTQIKILIIISIKQII